MTRAKVVVALVVALAAVSPAVAARPATDAERAAIMSAATNAYSSELPAGAFTLTPLRLQISTAASGWAVLDASATITATGEPSQGAGFVLRWEPAGWRVVTWGTDFGQCRHLRADGMPAVAIDDLRVLPIRYRCAAMPAGRIPCINPNDEHMARHLRKPRGCDISLDGTTMPANAALRRLRALRWVVYNRTRAVAVGVSVPVHAPFTPVRARVEFRRPVESTFVGPVFTRVKITTRFGTSGWAPLGGT